MTRLTLEKPTCKQILIPVFSALFLLFLSLYLLDQPLPEALLSRKSLYVSAMIGISGLLLLGSLYCYLRKARILSYLSAICLLMGVGCSYQFFFPDYQKFLSMLLLATVSGVGVYIIYRRINILNNLLFWLCAGAIAGLLAANVLFGVAEYGAKLWLDLGVFMLQPGELIKVLLVLLGASAFRNPVRSLTYCVMSLVSCAVLLKLNDLGGVVVIFAMFVVMTYLLFDSRWLSIGIIAVAAVALVIALQHMPYAAERFGGWLHAMENPNSYQQRSFLLGILMGGFRGLGVEDYEIFTRIFAADNDGAVAGVLAVLGVPTALITMGAYAVLAGQAAVNRSVYTSGFLIHAQLGVYILVHALLNFAGSTDLLPFTGVVAPMISAGGSATLSFGMLLGLGAAALNPRLKPYLYQ